MIHVILPTHLRRLAGVNREVTLQVEGQPTQQILLDALEAQYPVLRGTIRDQNTYQRRAFIRFFACGQDLSHDPPETPLPRSVVIGDDPFLIVGAMAGG
jgi:sulfur-carrier protein